MIFIALGANLRREDGAGPRATCIAARAAVGRLDGIEQVAASGWYASPAEPPSAQPAYVNGVVAYRDVAGPLDPAVLLAALQDIEARFGRVRSLPNAARTLDLDIVAIDGLRRDAPDPVLPHPRAHLRGFVLAPLAEIAPDWRHPVLGRSAAELLADLPPAARPVLLPPGPGQ